jgi:hypothetical protein
LLAVYAVVAYWLVPAFWTTYDRHRPFLEMPHLTRTGAGVAGDPLNVSLVGSEDDVLRIMKAASWVLAARLGVRTDLAIAADTVLDRPDPSAPVSNLYLFGRREDLAFEQEVGHSPRQRHHVRFWRTDQVHADGRPIWVGAAVYDRGVGFSRTTGQITHLTSPDVDAERDYLFQCLSRTGDLAEQYAVDGYHAESEGRNGDGEPWRTDRRLLVGVIAIPRK